MAKPIGPVCNLRCEYCFYLEKEALYPDGEQYRMSDEVLEAYIRQVVQAHADIPELLFAWQGGEPTLLGIDFFRRALELQKSYAGGKPVRNTLQTNGTLLDDDWCRFLKKNDFLVGLSLDGPEELHDRYRRDAGGGPTFAKVMRALELMKKHGTEFNILACVNRETSKRPLDVYTFFREVGVEFIQFIPIVELASNEKSAELGLQLGVPQEHGGEGSDPDVTDWTVEPEDYGDFLNAIFDEWVRNDVGSVFVMNFEWALVSYIGIDNPACFFSPVCGNAVIIEHNGDIYSCDHFMYPRYRLGNILTDDLAGMMNSPLQREFGADKGNLPRYCQECKVLMACYGECPKHRFVTTPDGEPGLNYLCAGYRKYFSHIAPYLKVIAELLADGKPATDVMDKTIIVIPKKSTSSPE
jgi:uncharacterized protein